MSEPIYNDDGEEVDQYGNPVSGDRLDFCCFPDCGCDGARLCMAKSGASSVAMTMNIERGYVGDPWRLKS